MLGNVFDGLIAVLFVEILVDRGAFERGGNVRAGSDECRIPQLRDFKDFKFRAQRFFQPDDDFFFEEIDDADEIVFPAEGELQRNRVGSEARREWCG